MLNAMSERPISTLNKPDTALELTLRPSLFSEFTGQPKVKERLEIAVAAAKKRKLGILKGKLRAPEDFDAPLPEEVLASFEGN